MRAAILAAPLILAACAAAPPRPPGAPGSAATSPAKSAAALAATDVPETPSAAEAKLLARIDELTTELDVGPRHGGVTRPQIAPRPFSLGDLPIAHIASPFTPGDPPLGVLGKSQIAEDIALTPFGGEVGAARPTTVTFKAPTFGEIMIGDWQMKAQGLNRTSRAVTYVSCGQVFPRYQPARWTTLRRAGEDAIELTISDGWMDGADCKAWVERRTSVKAKALLPGDLLYGFLDCKIAEDGKPACDETESLTVILPSSAAVVASGVGGEVSGANTSFVTASIPLHKGGGGSLFASVDSAGLDQWRRGLREADASPAAQKEAAVSLGVEVNQGVDDPEPIAIAYLARVPALPDPFSGL